jgi:hypothetical protein
MRKCAWYRMRRGIATESADEALQILIAPPLHSANVAFTSRGLGWAARVVVVRRSDDEPRRAAPRVRLYNVTAAAVLLPTSGFLFFPGRRGRGMSIFRSAEARRVVAPVARGYTRTASPPTCVRSHYTHRFYCGERQMADRVTPDNDEQSDCTAFLELTDFTRTWRRALPRGWGGGGGGSTRCHPAARLRVQVHVAVRRCR